MNDKIKSILEKNRVTQGDRVSYASLNSAIIEICEAQAEQTKQDVKDREDFGFGKMIKFKNIATMPNHYESF